MSLRVTDLKVNRAKRKTPDTKVRVTGRRDGFLALCRLDLIIITSMEGVEERNPKTEIYGYKENK